MKTKLVRWLGLVAVTAAWACGGATDLSAPIPVPETPKFSCLSNAATMRLPEDLRATLPSFGFRSPDDAFVAISNSVPGGFGGVFVEGSQLVLTFVDPATANQSRAQITQEFANRGFSGPGWDFAHAEIRGARWTFAELDEWYRYIVPKVGSPQSGISSTDIDEKANTISIGVIDEASRARLESKLASLNVSCNLVTTRIQQYATYAM
jgi:hypothetical protein